MPLEHVRIVDLTQAWAGAYALQLLADFGAEVIKIESRSRPDPWRAGFEGSLNQAEYRYPTDGPGERPYNRCYLANSVNRNKYGITLDLNTADGRQMFLDLVRTADVVSENFTPRVLHNLGIGYQELKKAQPSVILLSMPAFGLDGPYRDYPGIGGTIEPMSGNAFLLGEIGQRAQVSGVMYPDAVAGLNGAAAVLSALEYRETTGEGCHVEVSQHESMVAMLGEFFAKPTLVDDGPIGNRDLEYVPNGIYSTAGDDWIALTIRDVRDWEQMVGCLGNPSLCDAALRDRDARRAREDEIDAAISAWAASRTATDAEALLSALGVPTARVRSIADVLRCPQLNANGYLVTTEQPEGIAPAPMPGIIARLSQTPGAIRMPPVRHGEHSREVLHRILALEESTLDALEGRGIIGQGPHPA